MKILALTILCLAFGFSAVLFAQTMNVPPGHQMLADPDKFADGHLDALDQQLHLSADQKTKLRAVFLDEGKQLFGVLNDTSMSDDQKRAAIEKMHVATEQKVGSLLTPEQRKQWSTPAPENRTGPSHTSQT